MSSIETVPEIVHAEKSVLASILIDGSQVDTAMSILTDEDFYSQDHKEIFNVMSALRLEGRGIDIVTVVDLLKTRHAHDTADYAYSLMEVATQYRIDSYCEMIKDKSVIRKLITAARNIEREAGEAEDVKSLVEFSERMVLSAAERTSESNISHSGDMVSAAIENISLVQQRGGGMVGTPSFFDGIDRMTGGFEPGTFSIIAGRPSMGKSAIMINIVKRQAVDAGIPIGIFSLEMPKKHLGLRFLAMMARKNLFALRQGSVNLSDHDFIEAQSRLAAAPIWIDDNSNLNISRLRSMIRKLKSQRGIETFYIDHLGLMQYDHKDPVQGVTLIAKGLQTISRETDTAVIALCQLHRIGSSGTKKKTYRPQLSDLKQSGALEECADLVAFIHRDYYYTKKDEDRESAVLIVEKQRNGPTGDVKLRWDSKFSEFVDDDGTVVVGAF
jgi:replicative DNA helicase